MVLKKKSFPAEGELVICTITKILPHGAFARLEEYSRDGFIPIGEIASIWVRNIKDYIKEGQKAVAKILNVDERKGHIDLSVRRVNVSQKSKKMQEWKRLQKAEKLLEIAAKKIGKTLEEAYSEVGIKLEEEYGEIYSAFEEIAKGTAEVLSLLPEEWKEIIEKTAKDNVTITKIKIHGLIELRSYASDGVEIIKSALSKALKTTSNKEVSVELLYLSPPKYRITVTAPDYKIAERVMKNSADAAVAVVAEKGGTGAFIREEKR